MQNSPTSERVGYASSIFNIALRLAPGLGLSVLVAVAATFITKLQTGPVLLYALFLGIAFNYLSSEARSKPGIEFCSKVVLRLGVGLLGARITAGQIAALGWSTAAIVICAVVSTIFFGWLIGRRLGFKASQGVLCGGSVAICGASAALAISAVLPQTKDSERFTLMAVVTVTVLSTIAMVLYPLVAQALHLSPELAGLFLGGTIHDVAQVVGAGYSMSPEVGDVATVVKLFRVAMLAVVVLVIGALFKRSAAASREPGSPQIKQPIAPWFLWMFVGLVVVNSFEVLPGQLRQSMVDFSQGCLVVAIAALGMKTSIRELAKSGWRPMALLVGETLWMAAFVLLCICFV